MRRAKPKKRASQPRKVFQGFTFDADNTYGLMPRFSVGDRRSETNQTAMDSRKTGERMPQR
jgi:hypothetical protein